MMNDKPGGKPDLADRLRLREEEMRERARLYDIALSETGDRPETICKLLSYCNTLSGNTHEEDVKQRRILAVIGLLGAFVKRRANLVLLAHRSDTLSLSELHFCLRESNEALALIPVSTVYTNDVFEDHAVSARVMMRAYDAFQDTVEQELEEMEYLKMTLKQEDTRILLELRIGGTGMRDRDVRIALEEEEESRWTSVNPAADNSRNHEQDKADDPVHDEAYLATKERIHDRLGQMLLSNRYYLTEPDARLSLPDLLATWDDTMKELMSASRQREYRPERDAFIKPLTDAAAALGATLHVTGSFPAEHIRLRRLVISAARICITNAVRHGMADEITFAFEDAQPDGTLTFRISNNGRVQENFSEGGGLKNLRADVEKEGGTVTYETSPRFAVVVTIPFVFRK